MINNSMNKHQLHWVRVRDIMQLSGSTYRAYVSAATMFITETLQQKKNVTQIKNWWKYSLQKHSYFKPKDNWQVFPSISVIFSDQTYERFEIPVMQS